VRYRILFYWSSFSCFIGLTSPVLFDCFSCFLGLSSPVLLGCFFLFYWTNFSCFVGLFFLDLLDCLFLFCWTVFHVLKALETERNLIDRTTGHLISYRYVTAEFTVLRGSTVSSVNIYLQFYTYLIYSSVFVTKLPVRILCLHLKTASHISL
jgi:hypothetical protein